MNTALRVLSVLLAATSAVANYVLTFDDLTAPGQLTTYMGLTWVNGAYEAASSIPATGLRSLFHGNVAYSTSANAEAYTTGSYPAKIHSLEVASRQAGSLSLTIEGMRNGNVVYTKTVTVYDNKVTKVNVGVYLQHIKFNRADVVIDNVVYSI